MWDIPISHPDWYIGLITSRHNEILRHGDLSTHLTQSTPVSMNYAITKVKSTWGEIPLRSIGF